MGLLRHSAGQETAKSISTNRYFAVAMKMPVDVYMVHDAMKMQSDAMCNSELGLCSVKWTPTVNWPLQSALWIVIFDITQRSYNCWQTASNTVHCTIDMTTRHETQCLEQRVMSSSSAVTKPNKTKTNDRYHDYYYTMQFLQQLEYTYTYWVYSMQVYILITILSYFLCT